MIRVRIKQSSLASLRFQARAYSRRARRDLARVVETYARLIEADAKLSAPVDTGRLRASIRAVLGDYAALILTDVEYAAYVEFGTSRMGAQPYLFPALEKHRRGFYDDVRAAVTGSARRMP